jgi:peptidyl-prolyl cis-trans isomerase C
MKYTFRNTALALALTAAGWAASPVLAQTLVKVNGTAIPATKADALMAEQRAQGVPETDELKEAIREELIRRETLAQAAKAKGIEKSAETRAQMEMASQAVLIRAYLQDYVKSNPVPEDRLKAEYEKIKASMGDNEYHARHILLETEEAARAILARLEKGEAFAELAKESKDPGSKDRGGDLGWANPQMFVAPFSQALVALEKGKMTKEPVKSDFGWHIIQLEDIRPVKVPPMEEVKPQLEQRLQQQLVEEHIQALRDKAKLQ